ncbi:polysaccharide pyruvyl transferase family protein [Rosistilla oblonga]|uniref:Colanic acid biosynthesis protein n=1 Tax=Rosistilla oblonga TaxID=2527990 RepID=A0A518J1V9_9BACT|nr:polysaccharide pyruvyl transferase family protein [Rosistilla oblonga]QDV59318.1 colanic acid biosynthesis protein [Rosistilla oblonga]
MKFVEVTGTNFQNKGAELMLGAIASKCLQSADLRCAIQPWNGSFEKRARLGVYQKADFQRFRIKWHCLASLIPKRVRQQYGIVVDAEISAVLDASGFQFGDQWGAAICRSAANRLKASKRKGKKIILLPQAFGPFQDAGTREAMKHILDVCDLVFARDPSSLGHLTKLETNESVIRMAPDFTNLVGREPSATQEKWGVCILPNQRMLDKSPRKTSAKYIEFLVDAARLLNEQSQNPFFLIHETTTDRSIVDEVNDRLDVPLPLIEESDIFRIKEILGSCQAVVGARYHGLVSALSQGVPCIATGWSHKYVHLMRDYACEDYFVDLSISDQKSRLAELIDTDRLRDCKKRVVGCATHLKHQSEAMWNEVFRVLSAETEPLPTRS